jgi:hypothetical protein
MNLNRRTRRKGNTEKSVALSINQFGLTMKDIHRCERRSYAHRVPGWIEPRCTGAARSSGLRQVFRARTHVRVFFCESFLGDSRNESRS